MTNGVGYSVNYLALEVNICDYYGHIYGQLINNLDLHIPIKLLKLLSQS